jgi:hypothetical protein
LDHIGFNREPDINPERRKQPNPAGFARVPSSGSHGAAVRQEIDRSVQELVKQRQDSGVAPDRLLVLEIAAHGANPRDVLEARFGAAVVEERQAARPRSEILIQGTADSIAELSGQGWRVRSASRNDLPKALRPPAGDESKPERNYKVLQVPDWNDNGLAQLQTAGVTVIAKLKDRPLDVTCMLVQFPDRSALDNLLAESQRYQERSPETATLPPGIRKDFFDAIDWIGCRSAKDRIGGRLQREGYPAGAPFALDVDLWHPGPQPQARALLGELRELCQGAVAQLDDYLITPSLLLARVHCDKAFADRLAEWDAVAQINLPPILSQAYASIATANPVIPDDSIPDGSEPSICVVDSGVLAGHPLLQGWVVEERDFDTGDGTAVDQVGHGTQVAGLAAFGNIAGCLESGIWQRQATILSAKVLKADPYFRDRPVFPENRRPEKVVEDAIRHFHQTRGCRVFNLSLGNVEDVYAGGRQFAWAEVLDRLAYDLNIVIVVSAGNAHPPWPESSKTREQFQKGLVSAILATPENRLCNPATAALALTVGAISRSDVPRKNTALFAGAPQNAPAPFSRVGPGYTVKGSQSAVKPDFVAYGGNFGVINLGRPDWNMVDIQLGEPTARLNLDGGRVLCAPNGTSFAAPQVSLAAAFAFRSAAAAMRQTAASANAVRALLGACSVMPGCGAEWLLDPTKVESEDKLRLVGYGQVDADRVSAALQNDVCLLGEDLLLEDHWHLYSIAIPPGFLEKPGNRGITVSLAFDPPVRVSRRDYLARTMEVEVFKGLTADEVRRRRAKGEIEKVEPKKLLTLFPPKTVVSRSTLQVRRRTWVSAPQFAVVEGEKEPRIHVLVECQSRFPTGLDPRQRYALAVRFWHSDGSVQVRQELLQRVRLRPETRVRVERRG